MFCGNCGAEVKEQAVVCLSCGCNVKRKPTTNNEVVVDGEISDKKRTIALLLQFLIGFGAGMFYLGKYKTAVGMLVGTIIGVLTSYISIFIFVFAVLELDSYDMAFTSLFSMMIFVCLGALIISAIGIWNIIECVLIAISPMYKDGKGKVLKEA